MKRNTHSGVWFSCISRGRKLWRTMAAMTGLILVATIVGGEKTLKAEVTLEILKAEAEKVLVGLLPFRAEDISQEDQRLVREILLRDLHRSQVFRPTEISGGGQEMSNAPEADQVKLWASKGMQAVIWGRIVRTQKDYRFDGHVYDASSGKAILERRYVAQLQPKENQLRLMIHRFADEVVYRFTGEQGIAQTRIAYVSDESGSKEIYIMDYDGYNPRRITADRSIALTPRWSPDGRFLAYVSYKDGQPSIFMHELLTARRAKLGTLPGLNISPAWSPDGKKFAFAATKEGNAEIYVTHLPPNFGEGSSFFGTGSLRTERITFSLGEDLSPTWAPQGQQIAFMSDRGGTPQIYAMNEDGTNVRRLTFEGNYNTSPAWSPRGDWIAYTCRRDGYLKLCLISPDGTTALQLTDGPWDDEAPSWSPNGRNLVFSSMRKGKSSLYLITAGGRDEEQLTFTTANEIVPGWSWN